MSPRRAAALIALAYFIVGLLWIRFSDQLLLAIAADSALLTQLQTYKGWAFILVTASLLFFLSKRALERQRNLSERDRLTGLLNRHMFEQELDAELRFCRDSSDPLTLIVFNLDGFKQLNTNAGTAVGDRYLQSVANLLRHHYQQRVLLSRLDGDEFAIALPMLTWPNDVLPQTQHLQQLLRTLSIAELPDSSLTACFGIARFPSDANATSTLIEAAMTALDEAKAQGANRLRVYKSEYGEHVSKRTKLLFDLKAALHNQRLSVVYQPQFRLSDHQLSGVEVLARWHHPEEGMIPPDVFIPLAEQHGLICDITDFVMQTAIDELLAADLLYTHFPRVSFNVSAEDFNHSQSTQRFLHNLAKLPSHWSVVELELTETSALLNLEGVKNVLSVLHQRGVQVSLDDFGTGYSSINTLRLLPIQEVKIDQSFIQDITQSAQDARLVKTILAMAKALNLRVVAEGVETPQQAHYLKRAGCEEVQGYLYARPMPLSALVTFVSNLTSSKAQR